MGQGVHGAADLEAGAVEGLVEVDVLFRVFAGLRHDADGLDGVLARGGLAGEHDGRGTVVDGVRHVGDLRAGGSRVRDHALEHFGGHDDPLAEFPALGHEQFLDGGDFREGDLDAEVAAGDHDAVRHIADGRDVVDAGAVLDLRDDLDVFAAVLVEEVAYRLDVILGGDEGRGDEVHVVLDAEQQVFLVVVRQELRLHDVVREVHGLLVREDAAALDSADGLLVGQFIDPADDKAVVDEDGVPHRQFVDEVFVADGHPGVVPEEVFDGEGELLSVLEGDPAAVELADAVLGTLRVEHDGDRRVQFVADPLDALDALRVLFVGAVGKVQTADVHSFGDEVPEDVIVITGGTDGPDDLRFSHIMPPGKKTTFSRVSEEVASVYTFFGIC